MTTTVKMCSICTDFGDASRSSVPKATTNLSCEKTTQSKDYLRKQAT